MNSTRIPPPRGVINLPPWLDKLSARAARLPWWIIIIAVGLIIAFYSIANSQLYQRALTWVTDNPHLTTNHFANVVYDIKGSDGNTQRVRGILLAETADSITIETQAEQHVTIPEAELDAPLQCSAPAANGRCAVGQTIKGTRAVISGSLILEDQGKYELKTDFGESIDVLKFSIDKNKITRNPADCAPDPEGGCHITLTFKPGADGAAVNGVLLSDVSQTLTIETVPSVQQTVSKANIVNTISKIPAECAVNNISACDEGIFLTIIVTLLSFFSALLVGLFFGLLRVSANPVLFNFATTYVEVARGLPILVVLLFSGFAFAPWFRDTFPPAAAGIRTFIIVVTILLSVYYVVMRRGQWKLEPLSIIQPILGVLLLGGILVLLTSYFEKNNDLKGIPAAIIGLDFVYGAYLAELFRAGIQSIGHGQMEAARSLGMTYVEAMRYVILPQAFRVVLPPLGNEFIAMLKDTSLIAILALPELTQRARLFASDTYRTIEPYLTICVLYLCMTLFLSFLVRTVERRLSTR